MILCDRDLRSLIFDHGLIREPDPTLINSASVDIRIGNHMIRELKVKPEEIPGKGMLVDPGTFLLVDTLEYMRIPNGYGADLRLKSSTARKGWNHSLAFWLDPGYEGRPTMEIKNINQWTSLLLAPGERFAQLVVYRLTGLADRPYQGRYQGAETVELAKA